MQSFSNLISELTSYHFIHILFAGVESLRLFHIHGRSLRTCFCGEDYQRNHGRNDRICWILFHCLLTSSLLEVWALSLLLCWNFWNGFFLMVQKLYFRIVIFHLSAALTAIWSLLREDNSLKKWVLSYASLFLTQFLAQRKFQILFNLNKYSQFILKIFSVYSVLP